MNDIERVMNGQCIHGFSHQRECGTCVLTRYMGVSLRRLLQAMFPTERSDG